MLNNLDSYFPDGPSLESLTIEDESLNHIGSKILLLDEEDDAPEDSWISRLGLSQNREIKVICVVGKTGEGKSHLCNNGIFGGEKIFAEGSDSNGQGIWCAYHGGIKALVLDTHGLSGPPGQNEGKAYRRLFKAMALSDLIIYKTTSEKLHNDLFYFLNDFSIAYKHHFCPIISSFSDASCPSVLIYHETQFTDVLDRVSAGRIFKKRFGSLNLNKESLPIIEYIGFKAGRALDEEKVDIFRSTVTEELKNNSLRSFKKPYVIHEILEAFNQKFTGEISPTSQTSFSEAYFTCPVTCLSCNKKCSKPKDHDDPHSRPQSCQYHKLYDNKNYFCLKCFQDGEKVVVVPKATSSQEGTWLGLANYVWSGFVLECSSCGVIYRSRQLWYGNQTPESLSIIQSEISHIWPGERTLQGTQNAARLLLDGVTTIGGTVSNLSTAVPAKTMSNWVTDKIAPDYWKPNSEISQCFCCEKNLSEDIHHCRACGEGFCVSCSDYNRPCPERGWGNESVRVCKNCYNQNYNSSNSLSNSSSMNGICARKVGERVVDSLSTFTSVVFDYPFNVLKESARPNYWIPDDECLECSNCNKPFDHENNKDCHKIGGVHHCRQCGQGVCDNCSKTRRPVPQKGWDHPVRICDKCCT
ncbi:zinc finger FYVE domain-containing protein 1 [Lepeophtheirus salmonis]|uniref:zinc finger FYVE domain-containing protein 1 n=1 Tax=Lepeophtheirus salmonis TaxID=72036 RepID=UPI001AE27C07|nr:zinc finger FYVE domain-containing protein 1-like [Lepeophtheirus salmonis]